MRESIQEIVEKIKETIQKKEEAGKKDRSIKVDTKSGLIVKITKNPNQNKYYLSIGPSGGHPIYNKVVFDSSEKVKEFVEALNIFVKEREDILEALDALNANQMIADKI